MKVINKILCFLSVLVLCLPLLCFNVSAEDSSVGNPFKTAYNDFLKSDYKITDSSEYYSSSSLLNHTSAFFNPNGVFHVPFDYFKDSLFLAYHYGGSNTIKSWENVYYIMFCKGDCYENYEQLVLYSDSPIYLAKSDSYITYTSSSDLRFSYLGANLDNLDGNSVYILSPKYFAVGSNKYQAYDYSFSSAIPVKYDSTATSLLNFNFTVRSSRYFSYTWDRVFSNCGTLDTSLLPSVTDGNLSPAGLGLSDQIDVKLTPEFGLDMDILNSSEDRFQFSVTNNSDKPIQFCVYIDEPGNDNSYLGDYVVNPAYTNAAWNYKIDAYYYDIDITDNSKYLGFVVDNLISPVKCHGTIVWVYLDTGQTYSDYVYWKNVSLATGKYYNINFLACYVPDNLDIVSNIFDVELLADPVILSDFNPELRNDHWWTIDLLSEVIISDKMNSYKLSYKDVSSIYQTQFSLFSIPDYSSVSVGGNGLVSNGYRNDLTEFHEKDYTYNLDTGKEVFSSSGSFSNDFNMDDVSVDNVKSYITYCTDFFSLIKGTLSTFPKFIWVLIFFGLSAFVVVAIVKWIIS